MLLAVQTLPAQMYRSVTLDSSGIAVGRVIPMGNTVNDNFVVFYVFYGTTLNLKTRVVHADGTLGPINVVATSITAGEQKRFDVAWNPRSKTYLVIYFKGGKLWGQKVLLNGAKSGAPKDITTFAGRYWTVTSTVKKGFVLLMSKSGNLVAQRLRSNGKKRKGEIVVVKKIGAIDFLPFDSDSTQSGMAFLVYAVYTPAATSLELRILRLDGRMHILGSSQVGVFGGLYSTLTGDAYCAYDPDDDVFGLTWRFGGESTHYCIVNSSEVYVKPPTVTTVVSHPREIIFNVTTVQFMIHYQKLNYYSGMDHTEYYYLPIKPTGVVVSSGSLILSHNHENDAWGFGVSGIGSLMVVWVPETGPSIVQARLVDF